MQQYQPTQHNSRHIILTHEQSLILKQQAQQFQQQLQQQKSQFMKISDPNQKLTHQQIILNNNYFIVSSCFLTEWRYYVIEDKLQRILPSEMNSDILDEQGRIKPVLIQETDFEFIPQTIYNKYFKQFEIKDKVIKRQAILIGNEKRIPLYESTYKYLILTHENLRQIDHNMLTTQNIAIKSMQLSEYTTVNEFLSKIRQLQRLSISKELRLWNIGINRTIGSLVEHIKNITTKIRSPQYSVQLLGKRVGKQTKLCDLQFQMDGFFVIESRDQNKKWHFYQQNQEKCPSCLQIHQLMFKCLCQQIAYCSRQCKTKDITIHIQSCKSVESQSYTTTISTRFNNTIDRLQKMNLTQKSSRGKVGLSNLGNTCFMNSCLQCLSNTVPLTQYFISGCYEDEINENNPIGTKGQLARSYARFLKSMWCDSNSTFSPSDIKYKVSSLNPMFSGYSQHDSQEFFSFIVDGLHEDLNRIQTKPQIYQIDSQGRSDQVVASESWIAFLKRNQSIIVDLMTGQYRSQVTCPDCHAQSLTFDPFITVTLPIPQKSLDHMSFYLMHSNFNLNTQLLYLSYTKFDKNQWLVSAAKVSQLPLGSFGLYVLSKNQSIYKIGRNPISEIYQKIEYQRKTFALVQYSQEQISYQKPLQITVMFTIQRQNKQDQYKNLWLKFPFIFDNSKPIRGADIYRKFLQCLYKKAYKQHYEDSKKPNFLELDEYLTFMSQNRPFRIYLNSEKYSQKTYHKIEHRFNKQTLIEDNMNLLQLLKQIEQGQEQNYLKNCQIYAVFNQQSTEMFDISYLKNFDQKMQKPLKLGSGNFTISLNDCFQHLNEKERLQKGNEWYCAKCKAHKLATKQMSIYKAPKILILHLKRFKQKANSRKQKNQTKVIFPMQLNMTSYVISPTPMSSYLDEVRHANIYIQPQVNEPIKSSIQPIYELYAVSNHYGGMGGGHYTAYGKNAGRWYDFNDSSVRAISAQQVCSSAAYMLFYKRKDE